MSAPRLDLQPGLHDPVILMVSREAVESQDIMSVLGRLRLLSATREDAWLYREQLSIVYDGYENDPRELVDIEEVRSFAKRLHSAWPYWAFFMNQLDSTISLWLACLCGSAYPGSGQAEIDVEQLTQILLSGFDSMNALFDKHGFPQAVLQRQSEGITRLIDEMGFTGADTD